MQWHLRRYREGLLYSNTIIKGLAMADILLLKESREIMKQMGQDEKSMSLLCPTLKILQMRHSDLNVVQATKVLRSMLER